jgi:hypothetical protein
MIGKFEAGQQFQFYADLTSRILALVRQIKRDDPKVLCYRDMDFSHVFESQLYFGTVLDEALNALHAGSAAPPAATLSSDAAILLARYWFGNAARPFEPSRVRTATAARLFFA